MPKARARSAWRKPANQTEGFTMAELIITILIVSVLTAISLPLLNSPLKESKFIEAKSLATASIKKAQTAWKETGRTGLITNGKQQNQLVAVPLQPTLLPSVAVLHLKDQRQQHQSKQLDSPSAENYLEKALEFRVMYRMGALSQSAAQHQAPLHAKHEKNQSKRP